MFIILQSYCGTYKDRLKHRETENIIMEKIKSFLKKKNVTLSPRRYFVDAMGTMALGLFATLLMGTILSTLGKYTGFSFLSEIAAKATAATGAILAVAVAYRLEAPPLVMFSVATVGLLGNGYPVAIGEMTVTAGPAPANFCALIATEIGKLVSKETPIDILVTPLVTMLSGFGCVKLLCPPIAYAMYGIGHFTNTATDLYPVFMGAIVAMIVGVVLTLPISSAALCAMIGITGIAGGAATAGCCAQMIGFAVMSFKENRYGGLVAQGLGTSMLQMGNIVKNPWLFLPPTLVSAVTGALSAAVFRLPCTGVNAGMGTCGLVGPLGILTDLLESGNATTLQWIGLPLITIVLPAILCPIVCALMKKGGLIHDGDMKLDI